MYGKYTLFYESLGGRGLGTRLERTHAECFSKLLLNVGIHMILVSVAFVF